MTKSGISDLFFTILVFPYPMGQLTCLEEYFQKKLASRINSVQGRSCSYRERLFVALSDSSLPPELDEKLSNQLVRPPGPYFAIVPTATSLILKDTKKDLQQIFNTVLQVQALTTFEKPQNKLLKARSPNVYCERFYIEYYNFCQQYKNYFAIAGARRANQILFAASFVRD